MFGAMIGGGLAVATPVVAGELGPKANYLLRCSGCHGTEGAGAELGGIPPFPGFIGPLLADDAGRTYVMHVPGVVGTGLSDPEIAAVLNYIAARWSDGAPAPFTSEEVVRRRAAPMPDLIAYRRALVARLETEGVTLAHYPWP
ncbi:hypothetical protein ASG43_17365 [Aureimonas sp. Leaf454]|nr:hypothetical protein ASG43_17365 [Aureimonas sp. Leaf454]